MELDDDVDEDDDNNNEPDDYNPALCRLISHVCTQKKGLLNWN